MVVNGGGGGGDEWIWLAAGVMLVICMFCRGVAYILSVQQRGRCWSKLCDGKAVGNTKRIKILIKT